MLCTKANLCHKINKATNESNQYFIVACMHLSPSFKLSSTLKELETFLKDISNFLSSPVFIIGDVSDDFLKQKLLSSKNSKLLQYKRLTQQSATETRITFDSATLNDLMFHSFFIDNPECGIFDAV